MTVAYVVVGFLISSLESATAGIPCVIPNRHYGTVSGMGPMTGVWMAWKEGDGYSLTISVLAVGVVFGDGGKIICFPFFRCLNVTFNTWPV